MTGDAALVSDDRRGIADAGEIFGMRHVGNEHFATLDPTRLPRQENDAYPPAHKAGIGALSLNCVTLFSLAPPDENLAKEHFPLAGVRNHGCAALRRQRDIPMPHAQRAFGVREGSLPLEFSDRLFDRVVCCPAVR